MHDRYQSPLNTRYASREMQALFSDDKKFSTWRSLWIELAKAEKELGLPITDEQIAEMIAHRDDINYDVAAEQEKITRHDVMSHIHAFGEQCPAARPIIHLGATSCFVGDNTDLIILRDAMRLIRRKLLTVIAQLSDFALRYKDLPTLAFTHFQPGQPTTVGKRATLWILDLIFDIEEAEHALSSIKMLGSKGTTGTQASFRELFNGDFEKAAALDQRIAEAFGFTSVYPVSGQTYTRKVDDLFVRVLSGISQSAHKFSNDIRLLQHKKEIEEPFEKTQIGSSAMAYKRNPMRSERMASLSRYVLTGSLNTGLTAAEQWFERTLDDSANRRIVLPEAFLAVDAILELYLNISSGLVVYPKSIERNLRSELPFMATENILMAAVKRGGDRQELHEKIRVYSMEAGRAVKELGLPNDLLERLAQDPAFGMDLDEMEQLLDPDAYIGFAPEQTTRYIKEVVQPLLASNQDALLTSGGKITV